MPDNLRFPERVERALGEQTYVGDGRIPTRLASKVDTELRTVERATRKADCAQMCAMCSAGIAVTRDMGFYLHAHPVGERCGCIASPIRKLMEEADGE